jgi:pterin-4a-carbinolamine dehydratase
VFTDDEAPTNVPTSDEPAKSGWRRRERPPRIERRLEFPDYEATREFLDASAALSENTGIYPNLSFGRTYVNLTLFADEANSGELTPEQMAFAQRVDELVEGPGD